MTSPVVVLNVAEKNSVSREVTRLLCNGRPRELPSWWVGWQLRNQSTPALVFEHDVVSQKYLNMFCLFVVL